MGIFFVSVCVARARVLGRVRRRGNAWIESDARDPRRYGGRARTTRVAPRFWFWFGLRSWFWVCIRYAYKPRGYVYVSMGGIAALGAL